MTDFYNKLRTTRQERISQIETNNADCIDALQSRILEADKAGANWCEIVNPTEEELLWLHLQGLLFKLDVTLECHRDCLHCQRACNCELYFYRVFW